MLPLFPHSRINSSSLKAYVAGVGAGRLHDLYSIHPGTANEVQRLVKAGSRFGIGAIIGEECTHGYQKDGHTLFPAPITQAATWNLTLLEKIGRAVGAEAKSFGASECWGPILGLAREPRWGRTNEAFSEDTFLAKAIGRSVVRGIQNGNNFSAGAAAPAVSALLKHYAVYSGPTSGLNTASARLGRREVLSEWLPVFGASIREGALGVMSSYNAVDGEPASASHWLLSEVLRGKYGFQGATIGESRSCSALRTYSSGTTMLVVNRVSACLAHTQCCVC